jgi:hypothetical protein
MSDERSASWTPATAAAVRAIVHRDLADCDAVQTAVFNRYSVDPHPEPIVRYGQIDTVIVVAQKGYKVLYWEDIEEGFNSSPVDDQGRIAEHWCNQRHIGRCAELLD